MRNLKDWLVGSKYRNTAHHQQAVLALRELSDRSDFGNVEYNQYFEWGIAETTTPVSPGEDQFTDSRYYLQIKRIGGFDPHAAIALTDDQTDMREDAPANMVVGTNLAELYPEFADTHLLPVGTKVIYIGTFDVGEPNQKHYIFHCVSTGFYARAGSGVQDGSNKRWIYPFTQVEKTAAGYSGWTDVEEGLTGDFYNLTEDQNGASGLYGNGVDSANLVGTFDIQKIPSGTRVKVEAVRYKDGDDNWQVEYWTEYQNGIDGECDDEE